jgi:HEAT repeat protein
VQEKKQDKLPLDAKLLSEAVIELNISRRSVGMYPAEHPIVKESIERAFACLKKLFEIRPAITLGIAGDTLVVDEYKLDRKNAVFREFANSVHSRGISAITFSSGLSKEELTAVHELITEKDMPTGKALLEKAKTMGIRNIILSPLEFESFTFVEGARKNAETSGDIWGDYIYGLLAGKLSAGAGGKGMLLNIPPEEVARVINKAMDVDAGGEAYDRVITAYLKRKEGQKLSSEAYNKFVSFIDKLSPDLKRQFLSRSFAQTTENLDEIENVIADMTTEDFNRIARVFAENSSVIPVTLKNLIDKLSTVKQGSLGKFDFFSKDKAVVDDVELGEDILKLFDEDNFKTYVSEDYQRDLSNMLAKSSERFVLKQAALKEECRDDVIDRAMLGVMIEILESDWVSGDDYLDLITRLSEYTLVFIETGRFEEILDVYNVIASHSLNSRFKHDASNMIEYFFHSQDFVAMFIDAIRLWGRKDREGAFRLAKALKRSVIPPLINALLSEADPIMRKFYLSVLRAIGPEVNPYVIKKLNDKRWFVVRNMLYLLRECEGRAYVSYVKKFVKHKNTSIRMEALKTLLYFNTPDAIPFLKLYLRSENEDIRRATVRLAGSCRAKEAVPHLISILEKRDIFGVASVSKTEAVQALGDIGDRAAVGPLLALYNARSLFYREYLEELKVEIFRTLENYPPDSVQGLLVVGLRSENEEIRSICERLLARVVPLEQTRGEESA